MRIYLNKKTIEALLLAIDSWLDTASMSDAMENPESIYYEDGILVQKLVEKIKIKREEIDFEKKLMNMKPKKPGARCGN